MKILEGLMAGDLKDLLLPIISIDEYESKLDDSAIVIGFYIKDKDPANDLNRFIQKSEIDLLDTDVSPAPNEDGYFMVFVELMRDKKAPKKIIDVCNGLNSLTGIKEWKFNAFGLDGLRPLNIKELQKNIRLDSKNDSDLDLEEFFKPSVLDTMLYESNILTLGRNNLHLQFVIIDKGPIEIIYENNAIMKQEVRLDESALSNIRKIDYVLGTGWLIEQLDDYFVLSNPIHEDVILLRTL